MANSVSVLTLVRDRQKHLDNLIRGLHEQDVLPGELIVASMQRKAPDVPGHPDFPIRITPVEGDRLPLSAARNQAAALARGAHLVFLDVDCIPSPSLVRQYDRGLHETDVCLMGEVRYLPAVSAPRNRVFESLLPQAQRHPARPVVSGTRWRTEPKHRRLWGLSFALRKSTFERVGGFDERYVGYGGEETDFAERLSRQDVQLAWCAQAMALHQQHAVYSPPLKHFDDIVANADRFFANWGNWCMEYWLAQFAAMGLIEWHEHAGEIRVIRQPDADEIRQSLKPPTALWG